MIVALAAAAVATDTEFARHPAETALVGTPAAPKLTTPKARQFRTILRREASEGPNFNGHYRVLHWGCGTNCIEWAVIDLTSGTVWMAPEPALSCAVVGPASDEATTDWLEFRISSSLLYLYECTRQRRDRVWDVRTVYRWADGTATPIRTDHLGE